MNRTRRGLLLVALGLTLIFASLCLYILHDKQDALAGQNAEFLLVELNEDMRYNYVVEPSDTEDTASRTLSGYDLIGILRIPSAGIELPVLSQWSYDLLNVAPCRYSGSVETDDLILLGHSYKSHFRSLWQIQAGDSVEFTDANNVTYRYVVAEVDIIRGSERDQLASEHPLTLFTCTRDSRHRVVVRCDKVEEPVLDESYL